MTFRRLKNYAHADERERRDIENWIFSIDDPQTQQMFQLKFLLGLKYFQVALNIGGGMTVSCVKMRMYRYIKEDK